MPSYFVELSLHLIGARRIRRIRQSPRFLALLLLLSGVRMLSFAFFGSE